MCNLKIFFDKNSVISVEMCLAIPILTRCAWEPGSQFLHFVEVWQYYSGLCTGHYANRYEGN